MHIKKTITQKILASVLAFALVFGMMPSMTLTAEATGTIAEVTTIDEFKTALADNNITTITVANNLDVPCVDATGGGNPTAALVADRSLTIQGANSGVTLTRTGTPGSTKLQSILGIKGNNTYDGITVTIHNITFDGGADWGSIPLADRTAYKQNVLSGRSIIDVYDKATLNLEDGVTIQNGYCTHSIRSNGYYEWEDPNPGAPREGSNPYGGGVRIDYFYGGTINVKAGSTIKDCSTYNTTYGSYGGAIGAYSYGRLNVYGGTIQNASSHSGGGIGATWKGGLPETSAATSKMYDGLIKDCYATSTGGAFYMDGYATEAGGTYTDAVSHIYGGTIQNCSAPQGSAMTFNEKVVVYMPALASGKLTISGSTGYGDSSTSITEGYSGIFKNNTAKIITDKTLYNVTFMNDSEQFTKLVVENGKSLGEAFPGDLQDPSRTFQGWYNGETKYDKDTVFTSDVTLTAKWEALAPTVTFDPNNGTATSDVTVAADMAIPTITWNDFYLEGWYAEETLENKVTLDEMKALTSNITVYAKWQAGETDTRPVNKVSDFIVTGGKYGTDYIYTYTELKVLTDEEITIENFDKDTPTTDYIGTEKNGITANITLAGVNIKTTYPFYARAPLNLTLAEGTVNTLDGNPSLINYEEMIKLDGTGELHTLRESGKSIYAKTFVIANTLEFATSDTAIPSDDAVYTRGTDAEVQFTNDDKYVRIKPSVPAVVFDPNNGEDSIFKEFPETGTITVPTFSWKTYKLAGWYTEKEFTNKVEDPTTLTESTTLYARWTNNDKTVITKPIVIDDNTAYFDKISTEGWKWDKDTSTLTLDGLTMDIVGVHQDKDQETITTAIDFDFIYDTYEDKEAFVNLKDGSSNYITGIAKGISTDAETTYSGKGTLITNTESQGLSGHDIIIKEGTYDLTVTSSSDVSAAISAGFLTVDGGHIEANGVNIGIHALNKMTVNDGTVIATSTSTNSATNSAIACINNAFHVNGGEVTATAAAGELALSYVDFDTGVLEALEIKTNATLTVKAGTDKDNATDTSYTGQSYVNIKVADPDRIAVDTAKGLIEGGTYTFTQATANTEETAKAEIAKQINALTGMSDTGITVTANDITITDFVPATEGNSSDNDGTNGSFNFTVDVTKGNETDTTTSNSATITATPYIPLTDTDIESFVIDNQIGVTTIDKDNHTVSILMPYGTDVTALTPTITTSTRASISPTGATDFTNPVTYTVTAEDTTTTQAWEVTVTVQTKESTPTAEFTTTGADSGTLSGVESGMKYKIDDGSWIDISGASVDLTNLSPCTITVVTKGNGTTTADSNAQEFTITKAETPTAGKTDCTTIGEDDGTLTGVSDKMEYSTDGGNTWTDITVTTVTDLAAGTYHVRVKAKDTTLASELQELVIGEGAAVRTTVDVPTDAGSKVYTGETLVSDIAGTDDYTITINAGGINVGEFDVVLTLKDLSTHKWATGEDTATRTVKFKIIKAENNSIEGLAIENWIYDETASTPSITGATIGENTVKYTYKKADGNVYTDTVPADAGDYIVKATIEGTDNYVGAEAEKSFTIQKVTITAIFPNPSDILPGDDLADSKWTETTLGGVDGTFTWKDTATDLTADGDYTAVFTPTDNNYEVVEQVITVKVSKKTATIPAYDDKVTAYTGSAITHEIETLSTGITSATYSYVGVDGTTYPANAQAPTDAGKYQVTATFAMADGYAQLEPITSKLTINETDFDITGNVVENDGTTPVANAEVKLVIGNIEVAQTTSNAIGEFKIEGVKNGTYNLVVKKGSVTVTTLVVVEDQDVILGKSILPDGTVSAIVDVKPGAPNVVVGGLEKEADLITPEKNTQVEVKLDVEKLEAVNATDKALLDELDKTIGIYLDLSLSVTVYDDKGSVLSKTQKNSANDLLEIIIPIPEELQGKLGYEIHRVHKNEITGEYEVQTLTTTPNENNERIVVNGNKTQITVYTKNFSTYALSYISSDATPEPEPEPTPTPEPTVPETSDNSNTPLFVALMLVSALGLTALLFTRKKWLAISKK